MRKPPFPRAVPHRFSRERWAAVGACGVLALGHATRAAVDAHHLAYLAVLDALSSAAAVGVGAQLLFVDDSISWWSAGGVASLLAAGSVVTLTVGFPGTNPVGLGTASAVTLLASVAVLGATATRWVQAHNTERYVGRDVHPVGTGHAGALTRRVRPRIPRNARLVARAQPETARAREARPDPARPAA